MKKWFAVMLVIAFLLFGSVIGFNMYKQKMIAEYLANQPEPEFPVTTVVVDNADWVPTIEAIGFIEPNQGVTLTTQTSGVIDKINFESGQRVKRGDVLITLDSEVERANLAGAKARIPAAKSKFERYQDLLAKNSISKESRDEAEASYLSLRAEVTSLQATINRRTIRAPFDGIVGLRNVYLGQYLQPGNDIVRLEDVATMRFRFTVAQRDISKLKLGQTIDISVDSYPQTPFKGRLTAIEPAVNYQSGLVQVQADIPNNDGQLRAGMFARANVILPTQVDQIVIPQTSITYALYGNTVYVLEKDKDGVMRVNQRVVKAGERQGDKVHILEGIQVGEQVVTSGQIRLSNQAKVKVVENDALNTPAVTPKL